MKELSDDIVAYDISTICQTKGIEHVVISPGSRNAPLTINFFELHFQPFVIIDERSAAYFALGLAIYLRKPVILLCTSGTAVLNYHPAIAEAYYQNIPLIVMSADRPLEYIDQRQGQTIRQHRALTNHIVFEAQLVARPDSSLRAYNQRLIHQALHLATHKSKPIHLNIPFYEPLYGRQKDFPTPPRQINILDTVAVLKPRQFERLQETWCNAAKKMILVGQLAHLSERLQSAFRGLSQRGDTLLLCENLSNINVGNFEICHIDRFLEGLSPMDRDKLQPDLLITLGGMLVSKKIKAFLTSAKEMQHWHIGTEEELVDTFSHLTLQIPISMELFPYEVFSQKEVLSDSYRLYFSNLNTSITQKHDDFMQAARFSDLKAFDLVLKSCALQCASIHFSNSASVRYAQLFNTSTKHWYYANRGTSGIDGCSSTAVGCAFLADTPTILITGDLAWLYDTHAFWSEYLRPDFRCIVINNQGGGIFRIIPGPNTTEQLETAFEAHQQQPDICKISESFGFDYFFADNTDDLALALGVFFEPSKKPRLLEVKTPRLDNSEVLEEYFRYLKP